MEMTVKQKFREMVVYLMKADYINDDDVIESYTDSLMEGAIEHHESELKNLGDIGDVNEIPSGKYCKGDVKLGTGCGKCKRCIYSL